MRRPLQLLAIVLLGISNAVVAQTTVIQRENVRYEYAKVMRVTPVYQTLTATKTELRCDGPTAAERSRIRRVVGAVRGAFGREEEARRNCRNVPVEREFRRPIAYDVDYTYRGLRYKSRLAEDPGHLLRIRIAVMPMP